VGGWVGGYVLKGIIHDSAAKNRFRGRMCNSDYGRSHRQNVAANRVLLPGTWYIVYRTTK
jgi:hypothetical protein